MLRLWRKELQNAKKKGNEHEPSVKNETREDVRCAGLSLGSPQLSDKGEVDIAYIGGFCEAEDDLACEDGGLDVLTNAAEGDIV